MNNRGKRSRRDWPRRKPSTAQSHPDSQVSAEFHDKMVAIIETIDDFFNEGKKGENRKVGIVLLAFPFNSDETGQRVNYMSNGADRKEIVLLFKEMIARFEGQAEVRGRA